MYNPIKTLKTNTIRTLNILGLAKRVGALLFLAAASEVYRDPEAPPQTKDYWGHVNPIGPRAWYSEGKRVVQIMCYPCAKQEGVDVRVARIFNIFGPKCTWTMARWSATSSCRRCKGSHSWCTDLDLRWRPSSSQWPGERPCGAHEQQRQQPCQPGEPGRTHHPRICSAHQKTCWPWEWNSVSFWSPGRPPEKEAKLMLGWEPVVPLEGGLNKAILYFWKEFEYQANNQHISKPKLARIRKWWTHRNWKPHLLGL